MGLDGFEVSLKKLSYPQLVDNFKMGSKLDGESISAVRWVTLQVDKELFTSSSPTLLELVYSPID